MSEKRIGYFDLVRAAEEAGAIDVRRVVEGIKIASFAGESPSAMLASLRKWQPDLFHAPAERKASIRAEALRNWRPK